jgi:hypothetical protein
MGRRGFRLLASAQAGPGQSKFSAATWQLPAKRQGGPVNAVRFRYFGCAGGQIGGKSLTEVLGI